MKRPRRINAPSTTDDFVNLVGDEDRIWEVRAYLPTRNIWVVGTYVTGKSAYIKRTKQGWREVPSPYGGAGRKVKKQPGAVEQLLQKIAKGKIEADELAELL